MKKTSVLFFIFLMIICWAVLPSCKSKKEEPAAPESPPAGTLAITYASPQGQTEAPHEYDSIVVIFDHAIIPLEALSEGRGSGLIRLQPSVPGRYRWLNPKTLSFTPEKIFPFATLFIAQPPASARLEHFVCL